MYMYVYYVCAVRTAVHALARATAHVQRPELHVLTVYVVRLRTYAHVHVLLHVLCCLNYSYNQKALRPSTKLKGASSHLDRVRRGCCAMSSEKAKNRSTSTCTTQCNLLFFH